MSRITARIPVSVFIIAQNEADRITGAIRSVIDWVDEVIVVDGGSTDETVAASRAAGARVIENPWCGYGRQKRFGEEQCRNRWLLNIDADERVTPELAAEIRELFQDRGPAWPGYRIRIVDLYPHETRPRIFPPYHEQIRLYDVVRGRFFNGYLHDAVQLESSRTGRLKNRILHRSIRDLSHQLAKINYFTDMQAEDLRNKGRIIPSVRLVLEFPFCFLKAYLLKNYILHGREGFINAMNYAFFRFTRLAKYFELNKKGRDGH